MGISPIKEMGWFIQRYRILFSKQMGQGPQYKTYHLKTARGKRREYPSTHRHKQGLLK